ncbi:hypothetical protein D9M68_840470 [compost metagenome]
MMLREKVEPRRVLHVGEHHQTAGRRDAGEGPAQGDGVMGQGAAGLHRQFAPVQPGQRRCDGHRPRELVARQVAGDCFGQCVRTHQGFKCHASGGEAFAQALLQVAGLDQADCIGRRPRGRRVAHLASQRQAHLAENGRA